MIDLRNRLLRYPLGLELTAEDLRKEVDDLFVVYIENGVVSGCCVLTPINNEVIRLRQMAVDSSLQGTGIGKKIILFAEACVIARGYSLLRMHARLTALTFYEKLGYEAVGDLFTEVGIPHIEMQKVLTP